MKNKTWMGLAAAAAVGAAGGYWAAGSRRRAVEHLRRAAKRLLRVGCRWVGAVPTNDGLGASGENIARLMQRKGFYFVPYAQDDPVGKPQSLKADMTLIPRTLREAMAGRQLQPVLLQRPLFPQ